MGRRSVLPSYQVLTDQDSTSNFQSDPTECEGVDKFAYDVTVDSSVTGTLSVEYCNERKEEDYDWKPLSFGETTGIDGSVETEYRFQIEVSFKRVRLSWVNGAGTGNINAKVYGITVGA
jgi:hypothetical protein